MAEVTGIQPLPNYIGQFEEGAQAGTAAGTALAQNALAGVQTANQTAQTQAQIPLIQAQTQEAKMNAAMVGFRMQAMQDQMGFAQSLLDATNKPPINDALPNSQLSGTDAESGEVTSGPNATAPSPESSGVAPTGAFKGSGPGGALTFNDVGLDPAHIAESVKQQYGESGVMTPQEKQTWQAAQLVDARGAAIGMPSNYAGTVHDRYTNRVDQSIKQKAFDASTAYDSWNQNVINAPPGTALQALKGMGDGGQAMAAKLQAMADKDGWTPDHLDQVVRDITTDTARELWRYSGRKGVTGDDNVLRDEQNGEPVAGAPARGPGVNAVIGATARTFSSATDPVERPTGVPGQTKQIQRWQMPTADHPNGYASPADMARATGIPISQPAGGAAASAPATGQPGNNYYSQPVTDKNGVPVPQAPRPPRSPVGYRPQPGAPGAAPAPAGAAPAPAGAAPLNPIQRVQQANAPAAAPNAPAAAPNAPQPGTPPPLLAGPKAQAPYQQTALADTQFDIKGLNSPEGTTAGTVQAGRATGIAPARAALQKQVEADVTGADKQLQFIKAAQDILEHGQPRIGAWAGVINDAQRWLPGVNLSKVTDSQELAKYLGNAALQNAKATYGPRMSQMEVKLQLGELSPSSKMTPQAVQQLLSKMNAIGSYYAQEGTRAAAFQSDPNKDPGQFTGWQEKWYPGATMVNQRQPSNASLRYLKAHPEAAPTFNSTYGFTPE